MSQVRRGNQVSGLRGEGAGLMERKGKREREKGEAVIVSVLLTRACSGLWEILDRHALVLVSGFWFLVLVLVLVLVLFCAATCHFL